MLSVSCFQVYLHNADDIPQMRNLGFAVPPGFHSLVAVDYNTVSFEMCVLFYNG